MKTEMNAAPVSQGQGRTVVVVGGGNGIGAATATLLGRRGWRVVVADIDEAAAEAVAKVVGGVSCAINVLDEKSIERAAEHITHAQGTAYALVNSAAIFQPRQAPEQLSYADWDRIVHASHRGTYISIVEFAKRMAVSGLGGSIVNISSMVGLQPNHGHGYGSAKAAVNALTQSMAVEWGRSGIRVNAVSPGFVGVPRLLANIKAGQRYAVDPAQLSASGRLVEPVEVAAAIAFLLSDDASGITGTNLAVDAGVMAAAGWQVNGGPPPARKTERSHM